MARIYSISPYFPKIRAAIGKNYVYDISLDVQVQALGFKSFKCVMELSADRKGSVYYEIDDTEFTWFILRFS